MIAEKDQNIFDITIAEFGTLDNVIDLISANGLTFNSKLNSGQELVINNSGVGNEKIKNFVTLRNIRYNNNQGVTVPPLTGGDYNNDYSNDYD